MPVQAVCAGAARRVSGPVHGDRAGRRGEGHFLRPASGGGGGKGKEKRPNKDAKEPIFFHAAVTLPQYCV